ncbi:hypothetical protein AT1G55917 [Arabidopsis thaliana]|uniref:Uncharacterized protein n=1 Tax=Arabidopsis thaliana TaxID=3702 RepID=A0A1P8AVN5_ARATH|nr:uncharacterized protein AT1G55917 [Arabidopsis thaliana]ANM60667.1 hypothetical protein AT1G55917 [Arabidopsis thaliana]|eukprot:NP_001322937.1 hypothetical protein AT1G55917 [Arabidopsis thaliana]
MAATFDSDPKKSQKIKETITILLIYTYLRNLEGTCSKMLPKGGGFQKEEVFKESRIVVSIV